MIKTSVNAKYAYSIGGPAAPYTGEMAGLRSTRAIKRDKKILLTAVPLDALPMKYKKSDMERRTADLKYLRTDELKNIRQSTQILTNLKSYSRTKFQDYLSRLESDSDGLEVFVLPLVKYPTSGPSLPGSPIHNIKIREGTFVPLHNEDEVLPENDQYDHERRKTPMNIENIYRDRNEDFFTERIDTPPPSFNRFVTTANRNVMIQPKDPSRFLFSGFSLYSEIDNIEDDVPKRKESVSSMPNRATPIAQRTSPTKLTGSRRSSKVKKPRHWVDDLTVSSDGSDRASPLKPIAAEVELKKKQWSKTRRASIISITRDSINSRRGSLRNIMSPATPVSSSSNVELLMKKPDEIPKVADAPKEPTFICPSSETKSREYGVKDWLLKSTFTNSRKFVPL